MLNDILDFSKLQADKVTLDERPARLVEIAELASAPFWELAQDKGNRLSIVVDPLLPSWVTVDAGRLRQVIANFLSNANKFTTRGSIEMRITLLQKLEDCSRVCFSVQDTGIGIPLQTEEDFRRVSTS